MHVRTHTHMHTHSCTHTCTHAHTHVHTHTIDMYWYVVIIITSINNHMQNTLYKHAENLMSGVSESILRESLEWLERQTVICH